MFNFLKNCIFKKFQLIVCQTGKGLFGLVGYAFWRFVQAVRDPERGTDAKDILTRLGHVLSGVIYGGLAFNAALLVIGAKKNGSGNSERD
jgi:hypothetical protein